VYAPLAASMSNPPLIPGGPQPDRAGGDQALPGVSFASVLRAAAAGGMAPGSALPVPAPFSDPSSLQPAERPAGSSAGRAASRDERIDPPSPRDHDARAARLREPESNDADAAAVRANARLDAASVPADAGQGPKPQATPEAATSDAPADEAEALAPSDETTADVAQSREAQFDDTVSAQQPVPPVAAPPVPAPPPVVVTRPVPAMPAPTGDAAPGSADAPAAGGAAGTGTATVGAVGAAATAGRGNDGAVSAPSLPPTAPTASGVDAAGMDPAPAALPSTRPDAASPDDDARAVAAVLVSAAGPTSMPPSLLVPQTLPVEAAPAGQDGTAPALPPGADGAPDDATTLAATLAAQPTPVQITSQQPPPGTNAVLPAPQPLAAIRPASAAPAASPATAVGAAAGQTNPPGGAVSAAATGEDASADSDPGGSGEFAQAFAGTIAARSATGARVPAEAAVVVRATLSEVAEQVAKAAKGGLQRIDIALEPAALGKVDVRLEFADDGRIHAHFVAESREALNALRADARSLERALSDAGVRADAGSLGFSLRDGGSGNGSAGSFARQPDGGAFAAVSRSDAPAAQPAPTSLSPRTASGRLDIHA